jgi:hypothetical protein
LFAFIGCDTKTPQPKLVGSLTAIGGTIPIYQTPSVTDAQMKALVEGKNVVQRIQAGYDMASTMT